MPDSDHAARSGRTSVALILCATLASLVTAVLVRGLRPPPPPRPLESEEDAGPRIVEPLQFLHVGGRARIDELSVWIGVAARAEWEAHYRDVFDITGCPDARQWLETPNGQAFERLFGRLRRASREEAFAGLALAFELARQTRWKAGVVYGDSANAERVASLFEDWLRGRAAEAAEDALLYEPAVAAALVYGRVMRAAWTAPAFSKNEGAQTRARRFLEELTGARERTRTPFGDALQARHPRAFALLLREEDSLQGLAEEAAAFYPELDGACSR